jgi:hypothetical protein
MYLSIGTRVVSLVDFRWPRSHDRFTLGRMGHRMRLAHSLHSRTSTLTVLSLSLGLSLGCSPKELCRKVPALCHSGDAGISNPSFDASEAGTETGSRTDSSRDVPVSDRDSSDEHKDAAGPVDAGDAGQPGPQVLEEPLAEEDVAFLDSVLGMEFSASRIVMPSGRRLLDTSDPASPATFLLEPKEQLLQDMFFEGVRLASRPLFSKGENEDGPGPAQDGLAYSFGSKNPDKRDHPPASFCPAAVFGLDCSGLIFQLARAAGLAIAQGPSILQAEATTWNQSLAPYKLRMRSVPFFPNGLESGDIIAWTNKKHIGMYVQLDAGDSGILQSNGHPGGPSCTQPGCPQCPQTCEGQCEFNRTDKRGPRLMNTNQMIAGWGLPDVVLRMESVCDACPPHFVLDSTTCACECKVSCMFGQQLDPKTCTCQCPPGETLVSDEVDSTRRCCPEGLGACKGSCLDPARCAYSFNTPGACDCSCPAPFHMCDSICRGDNCIRNVCIAGTCPAPEPANEAPAP